MRFEICKELARGRENEEELSREKDDIVCFVDRADQASNNIRLEAT